MLYIISTEKLAFQYHEVHHVDCTYLPPENYQEELGEYTDDKLAMVIAILKFFDASPCMHCMFPLTKK